MVDAGKTADEGSGVIDVGKRIDILQKAYAEASNYDRHYSVTRSAITALLVTVALTALNAALTPALEAIANPSHPQIVARLVYIAVPALLLIVALYINLHFYRLTYACRLIELWIEEMIILNATGRTSTERELSIAAHGLNGLRFREDLRKVVQRVSWSYFDAMAKLLVFCELVVCAAIASLLLNEAGAQGYAACVLVIGCLLAILAIATNIFSRPALRQTASIRSWPDQPTSVVPAEVAVVVREPVSGPPHWAFVAGLLLTFVGAATAAMGGFVSTNVVATGMASFMPEAIALKISGQSSLIVPGSVAIALGALLQIVALRRRR